MRRIARVLSVIAVVATVAGPGVMAAARGLPQRQGPGGTFTVTRNDDLPDTNVGNGQCFVTGGGCTLRAAIQESSFAPDANAIHFSVGFGGFTIIPTSALPTVDEPTTIDGTTQPGFEGLPIVELNGQSAGGGVHGLRLQATGTVVKGLVINRFGGNGIVISASTQNLIQGNLIGTDRTGTLDLGNTLAGINLGTPTHTVGGDTVGGPLLGPGNLISGNEGGGIVIGPVSSGNTITGNLIGTDITGTLPLGNGGSGIAIDTAPDNLIGQNVIADSALRGIDVQGGSSGNQILSNFVGTDITRTAVLGNGSDGIELDASSNRLVSNRIQHNVGSGIDVNSGVDNDLANNDMSANGGLGIDLGPNGVTPNDNDDPDPGANNLQNFPSLGSPLVTDASVRVNVALNSTPNTAFDFHYHADAVCDGSGNGEGLNFGSTLNRSTNAGGDLVFQATFSLDELVRPGAFLTAIASRRTGDPVVRNTSELSACLAIPFAHTFTVDDVGDGSDFDLTNTICATQGGECTLRAAIEQANFLDGWDLIRFVIGSGARTITPGSELPPLVGPVTLDGSTQPGFVDDPMIELSGTKAGAAGVAGLGTSGLTVTGLDVTVKHLAINRFGGHGIEVDALADDARIQGCYIGTDRVGAADLGNTGNGIEVLGDADIGVLPPVSGGSPAGTLDAPLGNIISGNGRHGIRVGDDGDASVFGNLIGTNKAGSADLGNSQDGVLVTDDGRSFIGSLGGRSSPGLRNVVSGNDANGVEIDSGVLFMGGNFIGTDDTGGSVLGNARSGVRVGGTAGTGDIGTDLPGGGNVISGNREGIAVIGAGVAPGNGSFTLAGNRIGTNAAGSADRGNTGTGIFVSNTPDVTIGGTTPAARNVVSGNDGSGVLITGPSATNALILGNFIGTTAAGTASLGNGNDGVFVQAPGVVIGGTGLGARNIISGNRNAGVSLNTPAADDAILLRNLIGTDVTSQSDRGNGDDGVAVAGATGAAIGGSEPGQGNVISGNDSDGVQIAGAGATGNLVVGNLIGTNGAGTAAVGNGTSGVRLRGAPSNSIGGSEPASGNLIAGNVGDGVLLTGSAASGNTVAGNTIGIRTAGLTTPVALPNGGSGVRISGAPGNTIGGDAASANRIGGNGGHGVEVTGGGGDNRVAGNFIGTEALRDVGNTLDGVSVSAPDTIIGGDPASQNVICGNGANGVSLLAGSGGTIVRGNVIGRSGCRNQNGVVVTGVNGIVIGGTQATDGNVIGGNELDGVVVGPNADGTVIQGNAIGLSPAGGGAGNLRNGVRITASNDTQVGGTEPGAGNIIRFNDADGVLVESGVRNAIRGNSLDGNDEQPIDLGPDDGRTANDNQDPDTGANNLQNFPVLTSVITGGGVVRVAGSINSTPQTVFTIDVYTSPECDPSEPLEAEVFVGSFTLPATNNQGNRTFAVEIPGVVPPNLAFSVTATSAAGNTSEVSPCVLGVEAEADLSVSVADSPDPVPAGSNITYSVTVTNGGPNRSFGTTLTQTLGRRLEFVSATPSRGTCELTGTRVTCELGTMNSGATASVTIVGRTTTAGPLTNTSTVTGATTDPAPGNNVATATTTVT